MSNTKIKCTKCGEELSIDDILRHDIEDKIKSDWNQKEIENKLENARNKFLKNDKYLLNVKANERSMTHKLAEYLQQEFQEWNVDCEYNKDKEEVKRLYRSDQNNRLIPVNVYPDIIVHKRMMEESNLLVIEAKKSSHSKKSIKEDVEKLSLFMQQFNYKYAVQLTFNITKKNIKYDFIVDKK